MARWSWLEIISLLAAFVVAGYGVTAPASADDRSGAQFEVALPSTTLWVSDTSGPGEPVILLHPNSATIDIWTYQTEAFVAAGFRVIAFDRPGWGRSVVRATGTAAPVADVIDQLADRLHLGRFSLVGVAGGGYIALDYAAWKPERVNALVLAATGLGLRGDPEVDAFRRNSDIPGFATLPGEVRELSPTYRGLHPEGVEAWRAIEAHSQQANSVDPPLRSPNTPRKVASLAVPVLAMAGDADLTTPPGAVRIWAKLIPDHAFVLIPEAGHAVSWEQPEAFNTAVTEFLGRHRSR